MRKTILSLIIFTLILLTFFLWQEIDELNLSNKIDDDKVANFFTAFSGIVVSISLYYLYRQLREMKSGYLPDLYISYAELKIEILEDDNLFRKTPLKLLNIEEGKISETGGHFKLHNIGLGSSKNITIKWVYNTKEVKQVFGNKYEHWPMFETESQHIDFLEAKGNIQIEIPDFYFICCAPEYNFNADNHRELADKLMRGESLKPKLAVRIDYQDIQNEKYRKNFNVEIIPINDKLRIKFKIF